MGRKSELKSLVVISSGNFLKSIQWWVAKKDRLTLSVKFDLQTLKFPLYEKLIPRQV